jgi:hypothetical protein
VLGPVLLRYKSQCVSIMKQHMLRRKPDSEVQRVNSVKRVGFIGGGAVWETAAARGAALQGGPDPTMVFEIPVS